MAFQARSIAYGIMQTSTKAVAEVLGIETTELIKLLDWQAIREMNSRSTDALDVFAMFVGHTSISGAIDHLSGRSSKEIERNFKLARPPHIAKAMFSYWRFLNRKLAQMNRSNARS